LSKQGDLYRAKADDSETMAVLARAPDVGRQLLDLAKRWRDLAKDTECVLNIGYEK
jgi:hypothetical protein